ICFFFSSRRRHTRFSRDWSSDVCSSDLPVLFLRGAFGTGKSTLAAFLKSLVDPHTTPSTDLPRKRDDMAATASATWVLNFDNLRSEERRVGKEWRARGAA